MPTLTSAKPRILLSPPHIGPEERRYVDAAFDTNWVAPVGPHLAAFEAEMCAASGARAAVCLSSGTAALHLALRLLGVQAGDEIFCSTFTFVASANPILYQDAHPVFIDSEARSWNMDPGLLAEALAQRAQRGRLPRAIVLVDIYGQCAAWDEIRAVVAPYDVPVLEDAAEAVGATYRGAWAGTFGALGVYSFNGNKIMTTGGGGMMVSSNVSLIEHARKLATQARDAAPHYQHSELGYNYRMSNLLAGIGRGQLQSLPRMVERRRQIFDFYRAALGDLPGVDFMPEIPEGRCNRWLTCMTVDLAAAGVDRDAIISALAADDIEARPLWKPLHQQPFFHEAPRFGGAVADRLFAQGMCLPSGSAMTDDDLQRVAQVVHDVFSRKKRSSRALVSIATASRKAGSRFLSFVGSSLRKRLLFRTRRLLDMVDRNIGRHSGMRLATIMLGYAPLLGAAFYFAYELRWDFAVPDEFLKQRWLLIAPVVIYKLLLLYSFGQFRTIQRYFGLADFAGMLFALTTLSGMMLGLWCVAAPMAAPPRGVILMDFVLSVGFVSAFRLGLRVVRNWSLYGEAKSAPAEKRMAIIGAGDVGESLAKDLLQRRGSGLRPVFFVDDDPDKIGRSIHGLPIFGPLDRLRELAQRVRVNEFVITLQGATPKRVKEIIEVGRQVGATTRIIPSLTQLASGDVKAERARPVAIEDLLGRAPINLDGDGIARMVRDRMVLVTGAGGSIGSELCRQILSHGPQRLLMVDQSEIALFEIERELAPADPGGRLLPLIADVVDESAMRAIFVRHRPEIVFHAAAHKHVPLMERQPAEALKNNTLGTAALARLASEHGVDRFVFISTDKAINPTSVMGCSKRLAEMALQARQRASDNRTAFLMVRFGNVLGSSGSVIPIFRRQIAEGGPVTVTDPEMTRYFMTIPEAVGLVLQAAALGCGGDIFILDMSQPVKIIDLARQMIELSGYRPGIDIEIKITGLRPGEKLFEELRLDDETYERTEHPRIFRLRKDYLTELDAGESWLSDLRCAALSGNQQDIKLQMKRLVPEYNPFFE
jgi:FlaA1/EpsC-like NDP-sugar epimerase/dTDP-4-amino-4,6-dideoxygalactose transaminase